MSDTKPPVVFIHGLWLHACAWASWLQLFEQRGYPNASAPGWPGDPASVDEAREHPELLAGVGIDDVTEHYARLIERHHELPILIGHSFGGMIAEKLLGMNLGRAAMGIDAAQIKGVLPLPLSALHSTLPVFKNPANKNRTVALTAKQFHYSFGNAVDETESDALYAKWVIPAPGKPLFEAAAANFSLHSPAKVDTKNSERGPLLLIMGGKDHTVPESITKSAFHQYKHSEAETDLMEFADRRQPGRRQPAATCAHSRTDSCQKTTSRSSVTAMARRSARSRWRARTTTLTRPYPLDVLGAQTQGMIGYWLVQEFRRWRQGARRRACHPGRRRPARSGLRQSDCIRRTGLYP